MTARLLKLIILAILLDEEQGGGVISPEKKIRYTHRGRLRATLHRLK